MSEQNESRNSGEIIDLRFIINLILQQKWLIISVSVVTAIAALLITRFVITPRYTTVAYITLTKPIIAAEFDTSIQVSPVVPDTLSLAELAKSAAIIFQVIDQSNLEEYFKTSKIDMEAVLIGKNQLQLSVTDKDPRIATMLANSWAEVITQKLNELYGTGKFTVKEIETDLKNAQNKWFTAQDALEEYLPQSQLDVIEVELEQLRKKFTHRLNTINTNQLLILDAKGLSDRLSSGNQAKILALGDALSLIALQQRATGDISGVEIYLESDTFFGENFSASDAQEKIQKIITSFEEQNNVIREDNTTIKSNITQLSVNLEAEKHNIEELTLERDLAKTTYLALANQLEEIQIIQTQEGDTAKIGAEAIEPTRPSSPSLLINTFLAGFTGFLLAVSGVLIMDWWNIPVRSNRKES